MEKPAEFFVNYSLLLLQAGDHEEARSLCGKGLLEYPEDMALIGNHTLALIACGDLDSAYASALRRIGIRRDVHSIHEAAAVLSARRDGLRDSDLPAAIEAAKAEGVLIHEGLALNPQYWPLRVAEIRLHRFAWDNSGAADRCRTLLQSGSCPVSFRTLALIEMVEAHVAVKAVPRALELVSGSVPIEKSCADALMAVRMRLLAEHHMIGKYSETGTRIVVSEVADYYATHNESPEALTRAKVLEWLGKPEEAIAALKALLARSGQHREALQSLSMILLKTGATSEALKCAERLRDVAPWCAVSYDTLRYVAQKVGRQDLAETAAKKGDKVFAHEMNLFESLRTAQGSRGRQH